MNVKLASRSADGDLFIDWLATTSTSLSDITTETLAQFTAFTLGADRTRKRRLRHILRDLATAGVAVARLKPSPPPLAGPWRAPDSTWDSLGGALHRIDIGTWPAGLRGRRDQFLLTAAAAGLTRAQLRRVDVDQLNLTDGTVHDVPIGTDPDPRRCGRCATVRWVDTLTMYDDSPLWARNQIVRTAADHTQHQHQLAREPRWLIDWPLLPTIHPSGLVDSRQPISARQISAVIAKRQHLPAPGETAETSEVDAGPAPSATAPDPAAGRSQLTWDELDDLCDEVCDRADAVLAAALAAINAATTPGRVR